MGPWEVTGDVAVILVAVVVGAVVAGAVVLGAVALARGWRRRRLDAAEHMPDEALLREQALEHLRQVQAQWEGRAGSGAADPTGPIAPEPPAPTERAADPSPPRPPATPDPWAGPSHVGDPPRRGRAGAVARAVVAVIVLGVLVAAALFWLTRP